MPQHRERPASSLARGSAKTADIESARRDLGRAQQSFARELHDAAVRHRKQAPRPVRLSAPEDRPRAR
jgi:hypothetical protein